MVDFGVKLKEMSKERKQKLLLGILLACIALVLYYYLLVQPSLNRLGVLMPKVKELRGELASVKEDIKNKDHLNQRLKQLDEQVKKYREVFPSESDLSQLLKYLSAQARVSSVSLIGVEPKEGETISGGVFREVLLTLQARGGYHSLGLFLNRLETGGRMMIVGHFDLSADPQNPREHQTRQQAPTSAQQLLSQQS